MKIGTYVEIVMHVPDFTTAVEFYEKLGFKRMGDDLFTDGANNYRLVQDNHALLALSYYNVNIGALQVKGVKLDKHQRFTLPDHVPVQVQGRISDDTMQPGDLIARPPLSRLGKFGEFSAGVDDFKAAATDWQKHGFSVAFEADEPYPWGILMDEMIVVGLHQYPHDDSADKSKAIPRINLTYFAADMSARIAALKADGFTLSEIPGQDAAQHAFLQVPGGYRFLLFTGEI